MCVCWCAYYMACMHALYVRAEKNTAIQYSILLRHFSFRSFDVTHGTAAMKHRITLNVNRSAHT